MARQHPSSRDRGSILPMVMVFMVIGALIVIPMLAYADTVLRANSVAMQKTDTMEQLRGGARVAAADPANLFRICEGGSVSIPTANARVPGTATTCRQLSQVGVLDQLQVPYGGVAMQAGATVPAGFMHTMLQPGATDPANWYGNPADTSCTAPQLWCPTPKQDTVWLPALPEVATSAQSSAGHEMPAPRDCTVYFPGTYADPIVLDRPAYFVSGVYLFKKNLTVVGGADVVFGFGLAEGCVGNDAEAVLDMYPNPLPTDLNAAGNGATLLFADDARLIIDDRLMTSDRTSRTIVPNTGGRKIEFEINQRYVKDVDDTEARASILSVNGDRDVSVGPPATVTYGALDVPGVVSIAESLVKTSTGGLVTASSKGINPSELTAEPRPPTPPQNVVAAPLDDNLPVINPTNGAVRVSWSAPVGNEEGGSTITRYEAKVTSNPTLACTTDGATSCVIRGLTHGTAYTLAVTATNPHGTSAASAPVSVTTGNGNPKLRVPDAPSGVTVVDPVSAATPYDQAIEVSWTASASDGNGILAGYEVTAHRVYRDDATSLLVTEPTPAGTCTSWSFRTTAATTSCVVTGLAPLDLTIGMGPMLGTTSWVGFTTRVTAIGSISNEALPTTPLPPTAIIGTGTAPDTTPVQTLTGPGTTAYVPPAPPTWPVAPAYVPNPIVDINLSGPVTGSSVLVAGYVATPQGRISVNHPGGDSVKVIGGIASGTFTINAATAATMGSSFSPTVLGFVDVVVQRTVEIVTTQAGSNATSTLRAQINANGADIRVNSWVIQ